jgi:hypothetical protein
MASGLDSSDTGLLASACVTPNTALQQRTVTRRPQLRNDRTSRMNFGQSSRAGMPDKRPNSSELGDAHRQTTATATTQPHQQQRQTNNVSEGDDYTNSMAVKIVDISSEGTTRGRLHAVDVATEVSDATRSPSKANLRYRTRSQVCPNDIEKDPQTLTETS